jgi:hypothetical protein
LKIKEITSHVMFVYGAVFNLSIYRGNAIRLLKREGLK